DWKTKPARRSCTVMPVASCPSNSTRPEVGYSSPPRMRSSVVLPDPDGPSSATSAPPGIDSDTGCSAAVVPHSFEIASIWMTMIGCLSMPALGGQLVGVADFQRGLDQQRHKPKEGQQRGHREGGDGHVFVVKHL